jgi:hypothetical protein
MNASDCRQRPKNPRFGIEFILDLDGQLLQKMQQLDGAFGESSLGLPAGTGSSSIKSRSRDPYFPSVRFATQPPPVVEEAIENYETEAKPLPAPT